MSENQTSEPSGSGRMPRESLSPSDSSPGQGVWEFMNISHPSEAKASRARRAVRSHVTRQQHQREQQAAAARRTKAVSQPPETTDAQQQGLRFGSGSETPSPTGSRTVTPQPQNIEASAVALYPPAWLPYIPLIWEYCLTSIAIDVPDTEEPEHRSVLETRWHPFVQSRTVTLHAYSLLATAVYTSAHGHHSHEINLLELKGMTISAINSTLPDPGEYVDHVIVAIGLLASYEALFGDASVSITHINAMVKMVEIHGGLPSLGLDGLLEKILLCIDAQVAYATGSEFRLSPDRPHPHPNPRFHRDTRLQQHQRSDI